MRSRAEIAAVIERGQAAAEVLMTDRVRVWRESTDPPGTDGRGRVVPAPPSLVYDGPAKAQNDRTYPSSPDVGTVARVLLIVSAVHFPYGTTTVRSGDVCEWVDAENPRLLDQKVRLRVDEDKTWQTAVRMNVVEIVE